MPLRAVASLAAVLLAATVPAADAQTVDDFRSRARMRLGALYLTPSLTLDRLGVETNVFQSPDPEQDFVVAASPRLDAGLALPRRAVLAASVTAGADYYARFSGERSINPDVSALLNVPAGRLRFFAGARYLNTRRRPEFELFLRARRVLDEMHGGVEVDLSRSFSVELRGLRERVRFDTDQYVAGSRLYPALNRDETSGAATLRWRRTALSTFTVDTEVRRVRFLRDPARDNDSVMARVGAEFHPRALVSGAGWVGMRRIDVLGPALPDQAGLIARADLSFFLGERTRLTFLAERDVRYSYEFNWPYYVLNLYGVRVERRLSGRLDLTGQAAREQYGYQPRRDAPFAGDRADDRWTGSGMIGYRLNSDLRVGVEVRYYQWRSTTGRWRSLAGVETGLVLNYGS